VKASVWKCILIDCYCCIATFVYCYVQTSYFLLRADCMDELPITTNWLFYEVCYQYSQIIIYLLSNSIVISIIVIQQRNREHQAEQRNKVHTVQDPVSKPSYCSKIIARFTTKKVARK
jgi:hypothetical protein